MGEEKEDPQKLKRIATAAYDYENDLKWADYWSNILIPLHMAARSDVVDHFKRKFYQRYIDPDLVVEPMNTGSSSQPIRQSALSSAPTPPTNDSSRSRSSEVQLPELPAHQLQPNPTSMRWDWQTIQFTINAWVFVVAVLAIFPLVPKILSHMAYQLSFIGTACSSLYSLYSLYGFNNMIYTAVALIPVLCRSVEHVAKFLRRNFSRSALYRKYLEDPCVWVESNTTTLSILSSHAEIGLGFLLIISLFSQWQRNIIQAFMYWQLLKLMYHAPVTAGYHHSVWAKIGRTVYPFIHRYAPFLNSLLSAVQKWWFR